MYKRYYKLICEGPANMDRFNIVTTQGHTFANLMKKNNVTPPPGFIEAIDDYYDKTRWDITTVWESKQAFDEASKHPLRRMFWTRFEMEAFKHDLKLVITDGDTGESYEPLSLD